jgi:hypothetical protein
VIKNDYNRCFQLTSVLSNIIMLNKINSIQIATLICLFLSANSFGQDAASVPTKQLTDSELREKLVGSWRIVSASFNDVPSKLHATSITIKHVTPVHLIWIGYQPEDRRIFRSAGGSWTIKDGKYVETMRYGLDEAFKEKSFGKEYAFDCKFEDDRWVQSGILADGTKLIEVWQRVKPDEDVDTRPADQSKE